MDPETTSNLFLLGVLGALSLFLSIVEALAARRNGRAAAWRRAAEVCGLTELRWSASSIGRDRHLEGRAGAFWVRFENPGGRRLATRIVVAGPGQGPLTLRRETVGVGKRLHAREVELGDSVFDGDIYVEGPPAVALAVLDAATRPIVRRLLQGYIDGGPEPVRVAPSYEQDELRVEIRGYSAKALHSLLPRTLERLLDVARRLSPPEDLAARLRDNLLQEPEPQVRLRTLVTLVGEHPQHPATVEASRAAAQDPDDELRLQAGTALGAEGREVLLELASRETAEDSLSARAVRALGQDLPRAREKEILQQALRGRRLETARTCLERLGERADAESVDVLAAVMAAEEDDLAAAAATALGETGLAAAEAPLVAVLTRDLPALRVAAARALGRMGTVRAVPSLKEAAEGSGGGDLRRAARQAIVQIQSRISGAAPGQLSLAQAEVGQLSLAADDAGRLSLSPGDEK
jgi:HEAT repeat protein